MTLSPAEQHLAAAKEALRKEYLQFYEGKDNLETRSAFDWFYTKLTNQAKEIEDKIQGQKSTIETFIELNKTLMDDIIKLKTEIQELRLALITRDGNLTSKILKEENDRLKSELSKSTEEKAKAFDEGVSAYRYGGFHPINPYRDKANEGKQD